MFTLVFLTLHAAFPAGTETCPSVRDDDGHLSDDEGEGSEGKKKEKKLKKKKVMKAKSLDC